MQHDHDISLTELFCVRGLGVTEPEISVDIELQAIGTNCYEQSNKKKESNCG